MSFPCKRESIK